MKDFSALRLRDYLGHMLQAIDSIHEYIEDATEVLFLERRMLQDAVVRNIEILGEAANKINKRFPDFTDKNQEVPWEAIYYMRNRIIHGYASVDYELVWQVINKDLPELRQQIALLLEANKI